MHRILAALSICLLQTTPSLAASCVGFDDLLTFIAEETGYAIPGDCPPIDRSYVLQSAPGLRSQVGAFVPSTGRILLAPDLDTDTIAGRSYLLHELVHAAQYRAGQQFLVRCEGHLEREAYRVQTAWLRQKGEFREAMLLDWVSETLGRCPDENRPMDY